MSGPGFPAASPRTFPMQISDALERFLLQLQADGRSPHTVDQYARHVRLLAAWLAQQGHEGGVAQIAPEDLARFLVAPTVRCTASGAPRKATSANALRASLRGFFGFLHRAGLIPRDPSTLVRRAVTAPPPPRALGPGEEERLLAALAQAQGPEGERDRMLVELMLATGIRLSSALGLETADVDLETGVLHVRTWKGGRVERVFLGAVVRARLAEYLASCPPGPLFPGRAGQRLTTRHMQRRFRSWSKLAGLPSAISPHSLRHAFAMRLYERTGDVLLVKEALGHRSISSTLVYARAGEQRLRAALGA